MYPKTLTDYTALYAAAAVPAPGRRRASTGSPRAADGLTRCAAAAHRCSRRAGAGSPGAAGAEM
jgi:hypothetical protein